MTLCACSSPPAPAEALTSGVAGALRRAEFPAEYLIMAALPILFLVRISVGGGGGLPAGAGCWRSPSPFSPAAVCAATAARLLFDAFRQRSTLRAPVGFAASHAPARSSGETTRWLSREQ